MSKQKKISFLNSYDFIMIKEFLDQKKTYSILYIRFRLLNKNSDEKINSGKYFITFFFVLRVTFNIAFSILNKLTFILIINEK
jgi:hypothetical protein